MSIDLPSMPERKMYVTIDLDKFPEIHADVDDSVRFEGSGRVCSMTHNDYCNEMQIEVTKISIPTHTSESVGPMNEADLAMGKLKKGSRYG